MQECEYGSWLKEARKKEKMTLEALSEVTGYTQAHLSFVERSLREPSYFCMKHIANALGYDMEIVVRRKGA